MVVARLRAAGCVFAEEEAAILGASAGTPAELGLMVARRAGGEPIEQVVGWAEFGGLRIVVDAGVFVPRRRSEFLVSVAVGLAGWRMDGGGEIPVIVDLCCGTGALGLAVANGLAGWAELHAADLDPAAVACARRNVEPAAWRDGGREPPMPGGKGRVYVGDLFGALPDGFRGRADILICNAPYVPTGDIAFLPAEARDHEPLVALDGGRVQVSRVQVAAAQPQAGRHGKAERAGAAAQVGDDARRPGLC